MTSARQDGEAEAGSVESPRIARERRTVAAMIGLYCRGQHHTAGALCDDCRDLQEYALSRLARCPFGASKTTCARCAVHCYKPAMRSQIRDVMRWAGPRMLLRHPLLTLRHQWDELRIRPADAEAARHRREKF